MTGVVVVADSLDEALDAAARHPEAVLLQGGTDVMVEVNIHHRRPVSYVALRRVAELRRWHVDEGARTVTIGAGVPYGDMEREPLRSLVPALAEAARTVGSPQIRAAGSLGGNLGTCSPAGDGLPVLSALDAIVHLRSLDGTRDVSIHEFMKGVKRNDRRPGEIIVSVTLPLVDGWQGYAKVGVRNAMVIAAASACLVVDRRPASGAATARVALGAVGPTVIRCREAEAWLAGAADLRAGAVSADVAKEFGRRVGLEARPIDDHRSTAEYRRHAVSVLAERLLRRAGAAS
ncbi:MAG: FAD binding domain-containing protein [Acidimicrobiia bacterium]